MNTMNKYRYTGHSCKVGRTVYHKGDVIEATGVLEKEMRGSSRWVRVQVREQGRKLAGKQAGKQGRAGEKKQTRRAHK